MKNKDLHYLSHHFSKISLNLYSTVRSYKSLIASRESESGKSQQKKTRLPLWWRQGFQAFIDSTLSHWTLLSQTQGTMIHPTGWMWTKAVLHIQCVSPFLCDFDTCGMFACPQEYSLILPFVAAFEALVQFHQAASEERSIRLWCHCPTPIRCQAIRPWRHFVRSDQKSALNGRNNNRHTQNSFGFTTSLSPFSLFYGPCRLQAASPKQFEDSLLLVLHRSVGQSSKDDSKTSLSSIAVGKYGPLYWVFSFVILCYGVACSFWGPF